MCLAIPGRVIDWLEQKPYFNSASVEFGGVRREVSMEFVTQAQIGDYVLVHAGIAISLIDAAEAAQVLEALAALDLEDDITDSTASDPSHNGDEQ